MSWLSLLPQAHAQAPDAPVPLGDLLSGESKQEYEAGRILFGDTDYAGALVKFEQAYEHSREARLLWNMAVCEKNLRHYVRVLQLLERYLRDAGHRLTTGQRGEAESVMQTVRSLISEVRLTVDQDGAKVFLDDAPQGDTPLAGPLLVDLGSRKIRVTKPGFQDWEVTRDFAGHSIVVLAANLQPAPQDSRLTIFAEQDCEIQVDGQVVATGHYQGTLPAGEHVVYITAPHKKPFVRELVMKVGEARTLHVSLEAASSGGGGIPAAVWIIGGVVVAGGLATGAFFLFRGTEEAKPYMGTLPPFTVKITP